MTKKLFITTIFTAAAFLLLIPIIIFFARAPVLIIAEQSFIMLYGQERHKKAAFNSSLKLFRQVKTVEIANDAGDDIVRFAIQDVSENPYCVIFPNRFVHSAVFYHEQNPEIPVLLLEGRNPQDSNLPAILQNGRFFIYKTDINGDFYKAGLAAASLSEKSKNIVVFIDIIQDSIIGFQAREAFFLGINEYFLFEEQPQVHFFYSFSDLLENIEISCVLMTGAGSEYFETNTGSPVILFSWLDPLLAPSATAIIIDDSPWAQAAAAVKMAEKAKEGIIKSNFIILNKKIFNKELYKKLIN